MPSPNTPYFNSADVAALLGVKVPTVRRMVADEGLPAHRVARRLKFVPEEVDTWVRERNAAKTSAQILAAQAAPPAPDPDWVAAQVAQFTPEDLRRAAEVLLSIAGSLDNRVGVA